MEKEDTEGETCHVCVEGETVVCVERDIGICGGRRKCLYMWSNLDRGMEGGKGLRMCYVE